MLQLIRALRNHKLPMRYWVLNDTLVKLTRWSVVLLMLSPKRNRASVIKSLYRVLDRPDEFASATFEPMRRIVVYPKKELL